jgi:hypothetical protein
VVLEAALAEADRRFTTVVLASEKESLYARFGFRPRALQVHVAAGTDAHARARPLDVRRAEDARVWVEAMRTRVALSDRFAVLDRGAVNTFDALNVDGTSAPLWHDEELDAVYYARREGNRVIVDDLFVARPIEGERLLSGLPWSCAEVAFGFDPQKLGLAARAEPRPYEPADDRLLVRGGEIPSDAPVAWPAYSFT